MVAHGVCCYRALPCSLLEQGAQSTSYPVHASRVGCSATDSLMSMTSWMDPSKGHVISCIPRGMDPSIHPSRGMLLVTMSSRSTPLLWCMLLSTTATA